MANSRARTQLKGSADYSAPILKAHRLETRTQHLLLINLREQRNITHFYCDGCSCLFDISMWRFGSNDVTARLRAASISRRERYRVLITVTYKNVFLLKYVVDNWIKIFIAFSVSDGYLFFTESQK